VRESFSLEPIGIVRSCYPDKFGTPRQPGLVPEALAKIHLYPKAQPEESLVGLGGFSHIWVLFWFHQNKGERFHAKVHPPRLGGEPLGVFATRSPHRPNPIGLSLLEIVSVESDGIVVKGIDVISGTPVLDIKPYLSEVESIPTATAGWTSELDPAEIEVEWTEESLAALNRWATQGRHESLKNLIESTLKLDPRPNVYKGFEGQESRYRNHHAVRFYDGDVHFHFVSPKKIQILQVIHPFRGLISVVR